MERPNLLLFALIGVAIWWISQQTPDSPVVPTPTPAPVVDLLTPFKANVNKAEAKAHAQAFGELCQALAKGIEWDGHKAIPRIKTGVQMDDVRITMREQQFQGWSFSMTYPALGTAIDQYMQSQVGNSGGPIDVAQRGRWVTAFRGLSDSAFYAASQL